MDEQRDPFKEAREARKEKKNAEADRTTQALDNAASVAQYTPIGGYAKAYQAARMIDNNLTGGKLSRALSKTANATAPGIKSASKLGSNGLANNAGKVLAAKEKLAGKGGAGGAASAASAAGSSAPSAPTVKTSSNSSGPTTINGGKSSAKTPSNNKKNLNKEKKKQNSLSSLSNQSSEPNDDGSDSATENNSLKALIGQMTPMKIIIICIGAFLFGFIMLFMVLFNSINSKLEFQKAQAFSEISTSEKNTSSGYSIGNINIINNANDFKRDDYDFKQYNEEYTEPEKGKISETRDNSKKDTLLSLAKKMFPSDIYLSFFNIGNNYTKGGGTCTGSSCDSTAEVQFYQKVADIAYRYRKLYKIELDWPLLVTAVIVKSGDLEQTFANNLNSYSVRELNDVDETMSLDWEYNYENIPGYEYLGPGDARYDLQILAKNMVKKKTVQTCYKSATPSSSDPNPKKEIVKTLELEDIEDYKIEEDKKNKGIEGYYLVCDAGNKYEIKSTYTLDKDKFEEFLDEYIYKRYLVAGSNNASGSATPYDDGDYSIPYGTDLSSTMINVATSQLGVNEKDDSYKKYTGGEAKGWCACFIDWVVKNTEYEGVRLSSVIKQTSCAPKTFMDFFNSSSDANIRFYYNTKADKYKGRGPDYTPKAGDIIFFNWKCSWNSPSDGNNLISHVGIVTGSDGSTVYTIEGNTSDMVARRSHALNSCTVIGFGAWY